MHISLRLRAIADCVDYDTLCDIGTDHAYLPIYLAKQKKIHRAAACDINAKPLARAQAGIAAECLDTVIEVRHGGGLSRVTCGEFDTCVIAGIGGMLIMHMLIEDIEKARGFKQLILSPQSDLYAVRRFLHENGFKIKNEFIICESGKWYNIIDCQNGEDVCYSEKDYLFGKYLIERRCPVFMSFLDNEICKTKRILGNLSNTDSMTRIAELTHYLNLCGEVRNACLYT